MRGSSPWGQMAQAQIVHSRHHIQRRGARHAGNIRQCIDLIRQRLHQGIDGCRVTKIGLMKAVQGHLHGRAIDPDHLGAMKPCQACDLRANARRHTGHHDRLALQIHRHPPKEPAVPALEHMDILEIDIVAGRGIPDLHR